jgi:hypothetical protein
MKLGAQVKARKFDGKSVEHVLPQNPADDSEWLKLHKKDKIEGDYPLDAGTMISYIHVHRSNAHDQETHSSPVLRPLPQ